jgi:hypothetical protein
MPMVEMRASGGRRRAEPWRALPLVVGGTAVMAGACAPWLTLFAGLRPLLGTSGLYGRVLLAAGLALVVGGLWYGYRGGSRVLRVLAAGAMLLTGFCLWLVPRQFAVLERLLASAMVVPALGPGLFIALAGAVLVALTTAILWWREPRVRVELR